MFQFIVNVLSILGAGWTILVLMIFSFGGSVKVTINNTATNKKDVITDIDIKK